MPNNLNYLDPEGLNALWNRIRTRTLALQSSINELNTNKIERVSFDTTTGVLQQIKNDVVSSIVSASVLKSAMNLTKADVGLSGVDDNADENVIEIVKVNGSALTVNSVDKSVTVIVPVASSTDPLMDGSVSVGTSATYARADHRHPSDTTRAPQVHVSLSTTYGGATNVYLGHVKLTDTVSSTYDGSTYTAATPNAVHSALLEAKAYADGIAEAASVGEPNVIEKIVINDNPPLKVVDKTVNITLTTNLIDGDTPGTIKRLNAIPEQEGYVLGYHATALGWGTYAEGADQTVIGRFNILTGTYVADEDPEICHYMYGIGGYECKTWANAQIPQYFVFDEIVSVEMGTRPYGVVSPEHDEDSRIIGECDFKLENGILKIRYPKEEEEEEPASGSGTEGDGDSSGSESGTEGDGGSEGDPVILPPDVEEPTRYFEGAYIWVNYRSGTYVPDNTYAFVIGNGTSNSHSTIATSRSNALTVDWEGNLVTKGGITCDITSGILSSYLKLDNGEIAYYLDSSSNGITDTPYQLTHTYDIDSGNTDITYHWGVLNLKALTVNSDALSSNDIYESSLYTNYDGHLAIDSDGVDFVLPSGSIVINPDAEIFTDGRITMSNGSIDAISIDPTGNYPSITLTGSTSASNTYNSDNPRIEFQNYDASQNIQLVFTDFDTVQTPASLTLTGNQGGEYFIAPNIRASNSSQSITLKTDGTRAGVYDDGKNNYMLFTNAGDTWMYLNRGDIYSSGIYCGTKTVRTDGYFQVGGANPNTQYRNGSIEFTGDVAKATAPSATQYKNIVFLDNGGRDSYHRLAFIEHYKTTANENVLQFGVYNHMAGTGSNSWPVGMRFTINSSQSYFAQIWGNTTVSGSLLTSSGRLYSRLASGEAQIQADNNGTNKIYMYANSGSGSVGIWQNRADGGGGAILQRANNTNVVIFGNGNGNAQIYGWTGSGVPLIAPDMANKRVSYFVGYSSTSIAVYAQFNESSYSTRFISTNTSDARLKKYIKDTDVKALPLINSIQMRQFDWKNGEGHQCIGMIADELEQLDSKLSIGGGYDKDGNINVKSIDTFYLMGYLVKAIQELSAEVEQLKK